MAVMIDEATDYQAAGGCSGKEEGDRDVNLN